MHTDPDGAIARGEAERCDFSAFGVAPPHMLIIAVVLAAATFVLDMALPLGVAAGVPYVALVLMGVWFARPRHIYVLAAIGAALIVIGYFASPAGGQLWVVIVNRGLALFAVWITAFLIVSRKQLENSLHLARDNLEREVIEQTKEAMQSEARLHAVTQSAKDAIITVDKAGNIIQWNQGAQRLFGYSAEEMIGQPVARLIPERYRNAHNEGLARVMAGGRRRLGDAGAELDALCRDGSECPIELTLSDWRINGETFVTGIMRDITERRWAEEELRSSEATLSTFLDATIDYAGLIDRDGCFCVANKTMAGKYGLSRDELIGRPMLVMPLTETGLRRQRWYREVFETGRAIRATDQHQGRWYDNSYFPVYDEAGNVSRVAIFARDISEQKLIEENLRQLSRAVEQDPNAIFITDIEGTIQYVNSRFTALTGYSAEEAVGQNPRLLKSVETPREVYEDLWRSIRAGKEWRGEIKDRRKDGSSFWASETIGPVKDENGVITHFVATHEDITQRKATERAMTDARRAAEAANKAKTDLMANMSHELRTPLNAIIGFSETMTHGVFGPMENAHYAEYVGHIHASGIHLLHLINDILDVSAVEAGRLQLHEQEVSVSDVYEAAIRIIEPKALERQITVSGPEIKNFPILWCDPLRLKQIFINLLSNAVKFTPENGRVSCDASIDARKDMIITVTDSGIGMDEDGLIKALDKFGQVDSSLSRIHEGTGLGLPLVKGLVELHGGVMELTSALGAGTRVMIRFPAERVRPLKG